MLLALELLKTIILLKPLELLKTIILLKPLEHLLLCDLIDLLPLRAILLTLDLSVIIHHLIVLEQRLPLLIIKLLRVLNQDLYLLIIDHLIIIILLNLLLQFYVHQ